MHKCKCINVKGIVHPKIKIMPSVCPFCHGVYFYTITYSKVFLNLNFFLLLNVNAILWNKENQLLTLGDFHIFPTIKVNVDQQLFGYPDSPEYIILCSAQERNEYRFGTT